jgi:hypothetical protein
MRCRCCSPSKLLYCHFEERSEEKSGQPSVVLTLLRFVRNVTFKWKSLQSELYGKLYMPRFLSSALLRSE